AAPSGTIIDASTSAPWLRHDKGATFESFTIANPEPGTWRIEVYGANLPPGGESVTVTARSIPIDTMPPIVIPTVTGTLTASDWYTSEITVSWSVTDRESPVTSMSGCGSSTIGSDTGGTGLSCTATSAGGTTSNSVSIRIDRTQPVVVFGQPIPAPNASGWNNSNVSIPFTASDNLSGVGSTNPARSPLVLSREGSATSGTVVVSDVAGNSATYTSPAVKIDKTPPVLTVPGAQSIQYSDILSFTVSAVDSAAPTDLMRFSASGLPGAVVLQDNLNGTATVSGTIQVPVGASTPTITVVDPVGLTDTKKIPIMVAKEDTALAYSGPTRVESGTPVTLSASVSEASDGSPGDITKAAVIFDVTSAVSGTISYGPAPVSSSGVVSWTFPSGWSWGIYTVAVRLDPSNQYYQAQPVSTTVTVSVPLSQLWAVKYQWGSPAPGYSYARWPLFEGWQGVSIRNDGPYDAYNVSATVSHVPTNTQVIGSGYVYIGNIGAGQSVWSTDSFTLTVNMATPAPRCDSIRWRVEYDDLLGSHRVLNDVPQFPPGQAPGGCD
ncbi:MAG: hypothetical protein M1358_10530, partial [Chloroflexi bacterium]|nr:hypothetical protein [Chloroflexota bacterium]